MTKQSPVLLKVTGDDNSQRRGDVIFIHGLDGDVRGTWTTGEGEFWPRWLAEEFPTLAVWSVGYAVASSEWTGHAMPLVDRAVNILELLEAHGLGDKPTCFIAHSMGGLVVKQMLRMACDSATAYAKFCRVTRGVLFIATPHTGSSIARLATYLSVFVRPTVATRELQPHAAYLRDLNIWYRNRAPEIGIETKVYFETQPTRGRTVVPPEVADPGMNRVVPVGIDSDHIGISKPKSKDDLLFVAVQRFVALVLGPGEPSPTGQSKQLPVDDIWALYDRAKQLRDRGDREAAKDAFAVVSRSEVIEARDWATYELGKLLKESGNLDGAREAFRRASESEFREVRKWASFQLRKV